jgi:hypothetical protein
MVSGTESNTNSPAPAGNNIPPYSTIEGVVIFPSLPHVNFLSLLCKACGKGVPEFFLGLKKQYASSLEEVPWDDVLSPLKFPYFVLSVIDFFVILFFCMFVGFFIPVFRSSFF